MELPSSSRVNKDIKDIGNILQEMIESDSTITKTEMKNESFLVQSKVDLYYFLNELEIEDYLAYFLKYDFTNLENFKDYYFIDHDDHINVAVKNMIKKTLIDYILEKKDIDKMYMKTVNIPFEVSDLGEYYIRIFDPKVEKIKDNFYIIDFNEKRSCSDQVYQTKGLYIGCAVVGFFKLDEMKDAFYANFNSFLNKDRKILLVDLNRLPNGSRFEPVEPFVSPNGRLSKNYGEYVFRSLGDVKEFKIKILDNVNNINKLLLTIYVSDIIRLVDLWKDYRKNIQDSLEIQLGKYLKRLKFDNKNLSKT